MDTWVDLAFGAAAGAVIASVLLLMLLAWREQVHRQRLDTMRETLKRFAHYPVWNVLFTQLAEALVVAVLDGDDGVAEWILGTLIDSPRNSRWADRLSIERIFGDPDFPRSRRRSPDPGDLEGWLCCPCGDDEVLEHHRTNLAWPLRFLPLKEKDERLWRRCAGILIRILQYIHWNAHQDCASVRCEREAARRAIPLLTALAEGRSHQVRGFVATTVAILECCVI